MFHVKSAGLFVTCFVIYYIVCNVVAEPQTEEEHQAVLKYEEWLRQNDVWLLSNIQSIEQQVAKYRRTKKALNAKQRVVCIHPSVLQVPHRALPSS